MTVKLSTIIFDYGNTLVLDPFKNILKTHENEIASIFSNNGYTVSPKVITQKWNQVNNELHYPNASHFYQEERFTFQVVKSIIENPMDATRISQELLIMYRFAFTDMLRKDRRKDCVRDVLQGLKSRNLKLGILSNERKDALHIALRNYGILDYFDCILTSEEIGIEKPSEDAFLAILKKMGTSAIDTVYIGDDVCRDIQPANKMGIRTIHYLSPDIELTDTKWRTPKAISPINETLTISNFEAILAIIDDWLQSY